MMENLENKQLVMEAT
jgi:hypothetical protein